MPRYKTLTPKENSVIEYYTNPDSPTFNNWLRSYLKGGYSECKGYDSNAKKVHDKDRVQQGIHASRLKYAEKYEHNRLIAIQILYEALEIARKAGNARDLISAVRELNAISALHTSKHINIDETAQFSDADKRILEKSAREVNLKLSKTGTEE